MAGFPKLRERSTVEHATSEGGEEIGGGLRGRQIKGGRGQGRHSGPHPMVEQDQRGHASAQEGGDGEGEKWRVPPPDR